MPDNFEEFLNNLMQEAKCHLEIKGGFNLVLDNVSVENKTKLKIDNIEFITQNIITPHLLHIEGSALFACTIGKQFDNWCRTFDDQHDILHRYFADAIGSEIVEAAVDWLEEKINFEAEKLGLKCTNRYSPGYCEWNVSDQLKLFSFFPDNFCGIKINDSALMTPIKSISGIIGLGKNVSKKAYNCHICSMENCYLRMPQ